MQKWNCLIVDDEPPAIKILTSYAEGLEYLEIVGTCNNAFQAIDYLLKPVSLERFLKAVNKLRQVSTIEAEPYGNSRGFLYFRTDRKMVKVFLDDIIYIESFRDYIVIHRQNDTDLKVKYGISSVENMLPRNMFLRIHRSFIVSVSRVTAFTLNDVELGTRELPIGRSYPEVFKKLTSGNTILTGEE